MMSMCGGGGDKSVYVCVCVCVCVWGGGGGVCGVVGASQGMCVEGLSVHV